MTTLYKCCDITTPIGLRIARLLLTNGWHTVRPGLYSKTITRTQRA